MYHLGLMIAENLHHTSPHNVFIPYDDKLELDRKSQESKRFMWLPTGKLVREIWLITEVKPEDITLTSEHRVHDKLRVLIFSA